MKTEYITAIILAFLIITTIILSIIFRKSMGKFVESLKNCLPCRKVEIEEKQDAIDKPVEMNESPPEIKQELTLKEKIDKIREESRREKEKMDKERELRDAEREREYEAKRIEREKEYDARDRQIDEEIVELRPDVYTIGPNGKLCLINQIPRERRDSGISND